MAVAAHEGSLSLYALKPIDEIREDVQGDEFLDERRFQPVKEVSILNSRDLGLTTSSGRKGIFKLKGRY